MVILGDSGHARVVADVARSAGQEVTAMLGHDACTSEVDGVTIPAAVDSPLFLAIGSNGLRRRMANAIRARFPEAVFPTLKAPSAVVAPDVSLGEGTVVMQMACIQTGSAVGSHCIVNTGAVVDHDCRLGDFVHVSPHATLCGGVEVGNGAWIGAGATVIQGIKIGANAIVGAGSTVLHHVPANATVYGVV